WATFHYGRWGYGLGVGWFWVPGFVWAPAWVSWRYSPGFVCWAPYAPAGFVYARHWPGWVGVARTPFPRPPPPFPAPPAPSPPHRPCRKPGRGHRLAARAGHLARRRRFLGPRECAARDRGKRRPRRPAALAQREGIPEEHLPQRRQLPQLRERRLQPDRRFPRRFSQRCPRRAP